MKDFFIEKFKLEFHSNELLIQSIEDQEDDVPSAVVLLLSHIINIHHICLWGLDNRVPESHSWDKLPVTHLRALNRQNYLETLRFIEEQEASSLSSKHPTTPSELKSEVVDVLFHILQHGAYHRGQVILLLKENKLYFPSMQWIPID